MRANVGVRAQPFHHRVARLAAPFIATAPVARPALSDPTLRGPTEKAFPLTDGVAKHCPDFKALPVQRVKFSRRRALRARL